jgi:tRNA threonylcarbamoyladenosine biosynthesis protein TsaB
VTLPVIAFDCSTAACSVAVATAASDSDVVVMWHRVQPMQRGHAAALVPMIETALHDTGMRPVDIGLIAVTIGPGSFTGVRIGLATARGFAVALGVPLAGLTTIETLLAGASPADRERLRSEGRELVAAVDSHRGDYYVGFEDAPVPHVADSTAIARRVAGCKLLVIGDAAARLCEDLARNGIDAAPAAGPSAPDATVLARLALARGIEGWRAANSHDGMPRPLYLRAADVTLPRSGA